MSLATGSRASLGYVVETVPGTPETGVAFTTFRRKSAAGLGLTKESYDSEEVRSDRMLADSRHGVRRASGDVETELSDVSYSAFWAALLGRSGWIDRSTVTTGAVSQIFAAAPTNTITKTGTSYASLGFYVGDRINIIGGLNAGLTTIVGMSTDGLTITVDRDLLAQTTSAEIVGHSSSVTTGSERVSFTMERAYDDIDQFQVFYGLRVNSCAVSMPPTGLATATWNFLGKDAWGLSATSASSPFPYSAAETTSVLAAANGVLYLTSGATIRKLAVATEMNFTIDNQLDGAPVVGRNTLADVVWGNAQMVTGKLTVLFEDELLYDIFLNESEAQLLVRMDGADNAEYLTFLFPRCKFNTGSIGDAVATGLPVEMEFRALLPRAGTGVPQAQVAIACSEGALVAAPPPGLQLYASTAAVYANNASLYASSLTYTP